MTHLFEQFDSYLADRSGIYDYRAVRYRAAGEFLTKGGIDSNSTIYDIGAGWTELDYCLRTEFDWRGRYIPVDGGISEVDLNNWIPERKVEFSVALEIIEHLYDPIRLVLDLQRFSSKGVVISVPNPRTVDVLGIDETHVTEVTREMLEDIGFDVVEKTFYGGVFSNGEADALFATWLA